mgnify:CR=1 FL=1
MELFERNACDLSEMIKNKEISSAELTKSVFDRIKAVEGKVDAYLTLDEENAMKKAAEIDEKLAKGEELSPLAGIPVGIKDNISTKGLRTTCASKMLGNYVPPFNATVMNKLDDIVVTGKLNMDEFAMGSSTENSHFKPTKNPFDTERIPGGSSGGSAAAVAAREAIVTLGSDTGGSIRQPASYCGVVGLKPTYGSVSRYGLVAFASSLDQIGPLGKCVKDVAMVQSAIVGHDKYDATSSYREYPDFAADLKADVKGLRIGIPKEYFGEGIDPFVKQSVMNAVKELEKQGATVKEISLPSTDYALSSYYIISSAEASSNLARFDGVKYGYRTQEYEGLHNMYKKTRSEGFGEEVKRRIMLGSFVLSSGYYDAYYLKALRTKALIKKAFDEAFAKYDVIIAPAAPTTAPKIGSSLADPIKMYLGDIYTISVNLAGLPGITVPCGKDSNGLPIGMQIIGDCFKEKTIIRAAYAYEQTREYEHCPLVEA